MKKTVLHIIILLSISILMISCGVSAQLKKADKRYDIGEYYSAADLYRKAQSGISSKERAKKAAVNLRLGDCYRTINNHKKAIRAYKTAIQYKCKDSTVYLHNALSLQALGNYTEARKNFTIYLEGHPESEIAQKGLLATMEVSVWAKQPTRYVVRTAQNFNSRRNSDFSPNFMGTDGQSIVITSNRGTSAKRKNSAITGVPNNDLYVARKNAMDKWEELEPLEGEFNTDDDEGTASFTADGKTVYFTRCRSTAGAIGAEIYSSMRSGGQWTTPKNIRLFQDSTISVAHPAISPDGNTLYFVSDHANGFGGKDIWKSEQTDKGWSIPENLGKQINTEGNEMFPFVRYDGTLYFSSDGQVGFGGLDIYKAIPDSLGSWKVSNMLAPINTLYDDFGITFEGESERGFFSSNRNQSRGYDRIWSFELPQLLYAIEGKVTDEKGDILSDATIKMVGTDGQNVKMKTKKDGTFRIKISPNAEYIMLASNRGYLNQTNKITTQKLTQSKLFHVDFKLSSINKPIEIDNIFYEFGKWTLTLDSEKALKGLVKMLKDNPNITIEIAAHTDVQGTDQYNMDLSEKRAKSVVDYLIQEGIDADRLTSKGYGESSPVEVDKTLAEKYKFLKVGDILDEAFLLKLPENQRETVNQINRRTQFRVTKTTYKLY
jgi:peptidoglycan-associated lipoprotein